MWSLQAAEKDVDGEWEWGESTSLGRKMASLESSLRCSICSDFFTNPHSLFCGHVFCSECIRKHLDPKMNPTTAGICPSCRDPASLAQLRPCRDTVLTVQNFQDVRPPLLLLVQSQELSSSLASSSSSSAKKSTTATNAHGVGAIDLTKNTLKKLSHMDFHKLSKEKVKKALEKLTDNSRKKLRLDGDKETLERRYRDFTHLNNAQLGNSNPLTLDQMVTEITKRENAKNGNAKKGSKSVQIANDLKSGKSSAEASQGFSSLIQQIRTQKMLDKKKEADRKQAEAAATTATATSPCSPQAEAMAMAMLQNNGRDTHPRSSAIAQHGIWRVVHSEKYNAPFFFNSSSNTGQFKIPTELVGIYGCSKSITSSSSPLLEGCSPTQRMVIQQEVKLRDSDGDQNQDADGDGDNGVCSIDSSQPPPLSESGGPQSESDIVLATYQSANDTDDQTKDEELERINDESESEVHSELFPCTLVDSQFPPPRSPPSDALISEPTHSALHSSSSSSSSIASMASASLDQNSDQEVESNECPFCTFINPPLALVCEICLGEISQATQPVRRSQRIEVSSSQSVKANGRRASECSEVPQSGHSGPVAKKKKNR